MPRRRFMEELPAMPHLFLGTMGFSYVDWARAFYPRSLRAGDYLSYYSRHFNTVELDTTFHAVPPVARVKHWAGVTPDDFRFCVKTPKAITHEAGLEFRHREMDDFLAVMRAFSEKLAVVLIQLPPSFAIDQFDALRQFLARLPGDLRFAVEFRNATWGQQRTLDLLQDHRCALVAAEYLTRPAQIIPTTDFLYIRWIGQHERFKALNREQIDLTPHLDWWKSEIERVAKAQSIENIWGFFNNDYSGYAIATCRRFMRLMGLEVPPDPPQSLHPRQQQGKLFG
jgi:uncharacterized protein YecE (DUF72 family)